MAKPHPTVRRVTRAHTPVNAAGLKRDEFLDSPDRILDRYERVAVKRLKALDALRRANAKSLDLVAIARLKGAQEPASEAELAAHLLWWTRCAAMALAKGNARDAAFTFHCATELATTAYFRHEWEGLVSNVESGRKRGASKGGEARAAKSRAFDDLVADAYVGTAAVKRGSLTRKAWTEGLAQRDRRFKDRSPRALQDAIRRSFARRGLSDLR